MLRRDVPGFARREAAAQEDFERAAVLCEAAQEESSEGFSSIREDLSISDDDDELYISYEWTWKQMGYKSFDFDDLLGSDGPQYIYGNNRYHN